MLGVTPGGGQPCGQWWTLLRGSVWAVVCTVQTGAMPRGLMVVCPSTSMAARVW